MEDAFFLRKNGYVEEHTVILDSRMRDRTKYAHASHFKWQFNTVYKNVISVQVVDATVPRSIYNVDSHNNWIDVFVGYGQPIYKRHYIQLGNHNINTLITALNDTLQDLNVNGNGNGNGNVFTNITIEQDSDPFFLTNKIIFRCPYPFSFNMESGLQETLGFDELSVLNHDSYRTDNVGSKEFWSIDKEHISYDNLILLYSSEGQTTSERTVPGMEIFEEFVLGNKCFITKVGLSLYSDDTATSSGTVEIFNKETGEVVISSTSITMEYNSGILSEVLLIHSELLQPGIYVMKFTPEDDVSVWLSKENRAIFTIHGKYSTHYMKSPGIVNFLDNPYIIIKTDELPDTNAFGLARLDMTNDNLANFRLNPNYAEIEFHPISRLGFLTMRLLRSDGSVYDTKGTNFSISLKITTLSMKPDNIEIDEDEDLQRRIKTMAKNALFDDNDARSEDFSNYGNDEDEVRFEENIYDPNIIEERARHRLLQSMKNIVTDDFYTSRMG